MLSKSRRPKLCKCSLCLEKDVEGRWISPSLFSRHNASRLSLNELPNHDSDFASSILSSIHTPRDSSLRSTPEPTPPSQQPPISTPAGGSVPTSKPTDRTASVPLSSDTYLLHLNGLELKYLGLYSQLQRPFALEFSTNPRSVQYTQQHDLPYTFLPVPNPPPFRLDPSSPVNFAFLSLEAGFIQVAKSLQLMKDTVLLPDDIGSRLSALLNKVTTVLGQMYGWKQSIWLRQRSQPCGASPGSILAVDTTPYLSNSLRANAMPQFLLPGILLILILRLIFKLPTKPISVVLACLRTQEALIHRTHASSAEKFVPTTPKTIAPILRYFDLEPRVRKFVCCPRCFALHPYDPRGPHQETCGNRYAADSPACAARLVGKGEDGSKPKKLYLHNDFRHWLARFLCRPEIEEHLDHQKQQYQGKHDFSATEPITNIMDGMVLQTFVWNDGARFSQSRPDEFRLFFALAVDGFNPSKSRPAGKTATSTGMYLFCLNLPLHERQKPHNIFPIGIIPGPNKPSLTEINPYLDLIVEDFLPFWTTGVRYTKTSRKPAGVLARAAVIPVFSDALAMRQVCGFTSTSSTHFCTSCYLPIGDIENLNPAAWPTRNLEDHRRHAFQWLQAGGEERTALRKAHGIRYTPLLRLPYFDPIRFTPVDTMHNLFLGLYETHTRGFWGMNFNLADGDGVLKDKAPTLPSPEKMKAGRLALSLPGLDFLRECSAPVLFYLCLENDLRRASTRKKPLIRELARWRTQNGISNSDQSSDVVLEQGRIAIMEGVDLTILPLATLKALCRRYSLEADYRSNKKDEYIRTLSRMPAIDRNFFPQDPVRQRLLELAPLNPPKRSATAVLGRNILLEVSQDRERSILPPWIKPIPRLAGTAANGKLSADQFRVLCTVHLPITLIRCWGGLSETSRERRMLSNFLDLVNAVEIASMFVTSPQHREAYMALMTRYLSEAKALYPECSIHPNHHMALHLPEMQERFGPSPECRGFGWERYQGYMQQIPTNSHFGEIESTFMYTLNRMANLIALLQSQNIMEGIGEMYQAVLDNIDEVSIGTRLHGLRKTDRPSFKESRSRNKFTLTDSMLGALAFILNSEGGQYLPISVAKKTDTSQTFLHPKATRCHYVVERNVEYKPYMRSRGASNVLIASTISGGLAYRPARITEIFRHTRLGPGKQEIQEVFCVIQCLKPLDDSLIASDHFRRFGNLGGSLWSNEYDSCELLIRPSSIISHYAQTAMTLPHWGLDGVLCHALPLDQLHAELQIWSTSAVNPEVDEHVDIGDDELDEESEGDMD